MRVFITGGSGMLGRNIVREFEKNEFEICAPNRNELDLLNSLDVKKFIADFKPDLVVHCAGLVGAISENIKHPYEFCFTNLQIGLNVVHAAFSANVSSLINISSANIYPDDNSGSCMNETQILCGLLNKDTEGYGLAKACVTKLVEYLSAQYSLNYRTLIPCNLYGEWDSFDMNKAHMIPAIIRRLHEAKLNNQKSVEIWGDGSARREFLFAADLAKYIVSVSDNVKSLPQNMNVGVSEDFSVLQYNKLIAAVTGYNGEFHFNENKPVGSKLKRLDLGFAGRMKWSAPTSIENGIKKTYNFFLENEGK